MGSKKSKPCCGFSGDCQKISFSGPVASVNISKQRWNKIRKQGNFDYVVVGSSFCSWAFTQRILEKNPKAKILILERSKYFYLEQFENLPPCCKKNVRSKSITFQWKMTKKMKKAKRFKLENGMNNAFGGQSAFWRGWCPKPTREELTDWPEHVKNMVEKYFPKAAQLLNVIPANEISAERKLHKTNAARHVFGELQSVLMEKIKSCLPEEIKRVDDASLAIKADERCGRVQKISVAEHFLNLQEKHSLQIKVGCVVKKILHEDSKAVALQTNKGDLKLGDAKLILAMGVLPPTTLVLNSFPSSSFQQLAGIGTRFTAHFKSSFVARVPLHPHIDPQNVYHNLRKNIFGRVEMAALYIPGLSPDSKRQFHIQLSAILDGTSLDDIKNTMSQFPDVVPPPLIEQLSSSKDPPHIIFVCKTLGELHHANNDNWYRLNSAVLGNDVTCNTTLQALASEEDQQLWDIMDESTFAVLERLDSRDDGPCQLEYWHSSTQTWEKERPPASQFRLPGLVHEASTMWIGDDESSPVGLDYRFRGVENVYLTGAALFPTSGSWNPTCTITALALDLADKLLAHQQHSDNKSSSNDDDDNNNVNAEMLSNL